MSLKMYLLLQFSFNGPQIVSMGSIPVGIWIVLDLAIGHVIFLTAILIFFSSFI